MSLTFLVVSMAMPIFLTKNASVADNEVALNVSYGFYREGKWWRVQTDLITILFPTGGKKPMFLWWYSNDTDNVYVVKYKGLIEYLMLENDFYLRKYRATNQTMGERLEEEYISLHEQIYGLRYGVGSNVNCLHYWTEIYRDRQNIREMIHSYIRGLSGLHLAYLPFSACQWNLTDPISVVRGDDVSYISFNFTLEKAPAIFDFAESNVTIRCRFYNTDATENVHGLYDCAVHAGELKMDLVVNNWEWNIDRLKGLFDALHDKYDLPASEIRAGLALWVDLASIEIVDMQIAEQDASSTSDLIETNSKASDIFVGDQRVQIHENKTAMTAGETPIHVRDRIRDRYRLRFAKGSQTLAGFFDFVDTAVVIDATGDATPVNVTAAYIPAGNHMRLFIGYPYFGNCTLEHDPSIGVESVTPWLPTNLLLLLISTTIIIGVAVAAVKIRNKTINIVNV